jgi:AraC family transcriptional regulator
MKTLAGSFYGSSLHRVEAGGFKLFETVYPSGLTTPDHSHDLPFLGVVLEGESNQMVGRCVRNRRPGTLTYHPPGETHRDHFLGHRVRLLQIEIMASRLADMSTEFSSHVPRAVHEDKMKEIWVVNRLCRELRWGDDLSPLAVESLALELLTEVWRGSNRSSFRPPDWLKRAHELLQDRFAEQFSLCTVAKEVGVHSSHLAREFRRHYRTTMGEKVRELRIEFACRELSQSKRPLVDIAAAAGFCDQSHFSRAFKRSVGSTPDQFRQVTTARKSGSIRASSYKTL